MSKHIIKIKSDGDENVEYFLDDISIAQTNHDNDGWAGMESVDKAIRQLAKQLKIKIIEIYGDEEEE